MGMIIASSVGFIINLINLANGGARTVEMNSPPNKGLGRAERPTYAEARTAMTGTMSGIGMMIISIGTKISTNSGAMKVTRMRARRGGMNRSCAINSGRGAYLAINCEAATAVIDSLSRRRVAASMRVRDGTSNVSSSVNTAKGIGRRAYGLGSRWGRGTARS
jgi:hypothetical protein